MKHSAFNTEHGGDEHDHDMTAGVQEHGNDGDECRQHMIGHAKKPHPRGFHGKGGKGGGMSQGGGEGMASNMKGGKSGGKKSSGGESGEY